MLCYDKTLFCNFELIQFNEIEKDAIIASGEQKHWHIYDVIAKKIKKSI